MGSVAPLRRLGGVVLVFALLAFTASGCLHAADDDEPPAAEEETVEPGPQPDDAEFEFSRLQGVTTAEEYDAEFFDEDLQRWQEELPRIEDVTVPSTADDHQQPVLWLPPELDEPAPLLVVVHSWSVGYLQHIDIPLATWADENGWAMVHPHFRGPNDNPEATGSDLAVQDVIDAVDWAIEQADIDEERVYVIGFSGGGMMSLLVAGRHPDRFAAAVSWVPVYDLIDWYGYHEQTEEFDYEDQIAASCEGDPTTDEAARESCEHRSPSAHLDAAREAGLPVYIGHGDDDEFVPVGHALRAFNQLADEDDHISDEHVQAADERQFPDALRGELEAETYFGDPDPEVVFARESGPVTLVVFTGGHDMVYHPGLEWLARLAAAE